MSSDRTIDPQHGHGAVPSGLPLTAAALLAAAQPAGAPVRVAIADTAAALAADLATGNPMLNQIGDLASSITLTGAGGTLTAIGLSALATIAGLDPGDILVPVADNAAAIAGLPAGARALAGSIFVADSAANIADSLVALRPFTGAPLSMTLAGISPAITVSAHAYAADHAIIDTITNAGCVTVTGDAASVSAIAPLLARDARVLQVQVSDDPQRVCRHLAALLPLGGALMVTLLGQAPVTAAVALALVTSGLPHLSAGRVSIADGGAQLAAMARAGSAALQFLLAQGAALSHSSAVPLADAATLGGLHGGFSRNGHSLSVWDSAANLIRPGAATMLAALTEAGLVTGLHLNTGGVPLTLPVAQAMPLLALPGLAVDNPDTSVNTLTVADSAARLAAAAPVLARHRQAIRHVVILDSAIVTGAMLRALQSASAVTDAGVTLAVSDSAANILVASMAHGASVQASAWRLSAPANISAAEALSIAALPNVTTGPYRLTVSLPAGCAITVAQANSLAALAGALDLAQTGPGFTVHGNAAALAGLSATAAGLVRTVPVEAKPVGLPEAVSPRATAAPPRAPSGMGRQAGPAATPPAHAGNGLIDAVLDAARRPAGHKPGPAASPGFPSRLLRLSDTPGFIGGSLPHTVTAAPVLGATPAACGLSTAVQKAEARREPSPLQDEIAALQRDDLAMPNPAIAAVLVRNGLAAPGTALTVSASAMAGATINIYGADGLLMSSTQETATSFTVAAPASDAGFSITETVAGIESAPVVVIDAGIMHRGLSQAAAQLSSSGQIHVGNGHYIDLFTAGARLPDRPVLVYDPASQKIALAIPGRATVPLITLAAVTPNTLKPAEILVQN